MYYPREVTVECSFLKSKYVTKYFSDICCGEVLRNCCVNLGLDPDMCDGYVLNYDVEIVQDSNFVSWVYKPEERIGYICDSTGALLIRLCPQS